MKNEFQTTIRVSNDDGPVVIADIIDARSESLALFRELTEAQQQQLGGDAWSIGLRALANAYSQAQESRLEDVGGRLLADFERQLAVHVEAQQKTVAAVLSRFFDPQDGQVSQRLAAFVDDQGVLARLLEKYLAPNNSVLAETLARQVGENSPLLKKLSPTDADGLVHTLEAKLREVMDSEHSEFVRALDPLAEDGAVARFLKSLREELRSSNEGNAEQLTTALAALDANNEESLLSRLIRETGRASQAMLQAMNADVPNSPMAAMKQTLVGMLKESQRSQVAAFEEQRQRQDEFEKQVREALARIEARRAEGRRAPRGGLDFEQRVVDFVAASVEGAPCVVDAIGNRPGLTSRCKKGDLVVRFTEESAFAGAAVVFEAKHDASYSANKALEELDAARTNRNASAGVFVMARSHAPNAFPRFSRYGQNVLVTWDERDPSTDAYLHAAVLLGLALVTRHRTVGEDVDLEALHDIEGRIESELGRLERMRKHNDSIRRNSDAISDEVRRAQGQLERLVDKAKATLRALNVELCEEDVERGSPISLLTTADSAATAALDGSPG